MLNKSKKIKAFTILEITIVIVIIAILMLATMRLSGDRIGLLKDKNTKEQFLDNFMGLQSKNSMTSYYNGKIYQNLLLHFKKGAEHISYEYVFYDSISSGNTTIEGGVYKITKLLLDGIDVEEATVVLKPYQLGCEIEAGQKILKISILVNNSKEYSFQLNPNTCRIKNISNW